MEEPREEWKVEEGIGCGSKMSSNVSRGWSVAKKIVIAGVAISSAPIVLPPLVVLSTLGFAFAVPFGLVFAVYACTDKLMCKLLSRPDPYCILETEDNTESLEELEEDKNEGQAMVKQKEVKQKEEIMEDERRNMEVGDERGEKEDDAERVTEETENFPGGTASGKEVLVEGMDGRIEERGDEVEEDYIIEEEDEVEEKSVVDMKGGIEEQRKDDESAYNIVGKEEKPIEGLFVDIEDEGFDPIEDMNGVLEESRDEEIVEKNIEEKKPKEETVNNIKGEHVIEKEEKPIEGFFVDIEDEDFEPIEDMNGTLEESRDEEIVEKNVEEKKPKERTANKIKDEDMIPIRDLKIELEESRDKKNVEEKPKVDKTTKISEEEKLVGDTVGGRKEQSRDEENGDKPIEVEERLEEDTAWATKEGGDKGIADNMVKEEKKPVVEKIEDGCLLDIENVREIADESGLDLSIEGTATVDEACEGVELLDGKADSEPQYIDPEHESTIEEHPSDNMGNGSAEAAVSSEMEVSLCTQGPSEKDKEGSDKVDQEQKPIVEKMRTTEEMKHEVLIEETKDEVLSEEVKLVKEMEKIVEENSDIIVEEEKPMADTKGMIGERGDEGIADIMVKEEKKPVVETIEERCLLDMENAAEIGDESELDLSNKEAAALDEQYTCTIDGAREGVELLDSKADSELQHINSVHESTIEEHPSDNIGNGSADAAVSSEMEVSLSTKGPSENVTTIPSKEVKVYCEEKIWEQIDAMRKIVGYKAALHATCIEELKALYVFTGVEPPVPFKDPSDLTEVDNKLRLLMSIVGVK